MKSVTPERQHELIMELQGICEELGWIVAVPPDEDNNGAAPGIFVGVPEWVVWSLQIVYPDVAQFEAYDQHGEVSFDQELADNLLPPKEEFKKKTNLH